MTVTPSRLEVLYQDERYVAIHKPAGMLVHRSAIAAKDDSVAALQMLREQLGRVVFPVHRLDRPTSGALIFALDHEAMAVLKKSFETNDILKTYLAIVRGFSPDNGFIENPLRQLNDFKGPNKSKQIQEASTLFRTISKSELPYPTERYKTTRYSLVELKPKTGRRHQLRRHLDHIHHPIVGDTRHGDNTLNKRFRMQHGFLRLMLAATRLEFVHPFTRENVLISAHPSPDFLNALDQIGLNLYSTAQ